jgi:D-amino peptidase
VKFFISADMEGIAGTVSWKEYEDEFNRYRRVFTAEVRAVCEGILESGQRVSEILVCDAHGNGQNLLIEELPENVRLSRGNGRPLMMMDGLDAGFDLVYFVGYHSGVGTAQSLMDHTYSSRTFHRIRVNDVEVDEAMLNAALAGHFRVPVAFISGDDKLVRRARREFPGIETVVTKTARSRFAAIIRHPAPILKELKAAATRAAALPASLAKTYRIGRARRPELAMEFTDTVRADLAELIPGCRRLDGRTVRYRAADYLELYRILRLAAILGIAGATYL